METSITFNVFFFETSLRLYTEFQCSTMPGSGQKVCGVVGGLGLL